MPESAMSSESSTFLPRKLPQKVGLVGGGTIGGGWAARFVLNGVDVRVYDPAPIAVDRLQQILSAARRAYQRLTQGPLPAKGGLTVVETLADAVRNVELAQESVPEQQVEAEHLTISELETKHDDSLVQYCRGYAHTATAPVRRSAVEANSVRPSSLAH